MQRTRMKNNDLSLVIAPGQVQVIHLFWISPDFGCRFLNDFGFHGSSHITKLTEQFSVIV